MLNSLPSWHIGKYSISFIVLEKSVVMVYDVWSGVDKCFLVLENAIERFLQSFNIRDEDDLVTVTSRYPKKGHERKKIQKSEYIDIEMDSMTSANGDSLENGLKLCKKVVKVLASVL